MSLQDMPHTNNPSKIVRRTGLIAEEMSKFALISESFGGGVGLRGTQGSALSEASNGSRIEGGMADTMQVRYLGTPVELTFIRAKGQWFGFWGPERLWLKPALLASYVEKGWVVKV